MALYAYNGLILQEIPEDVISNYPYYVILQWPSSNNIQLIASKNGFYFNGEAQIVDKSDTNLAVYYHKNNEWIVDSAQNDKYTRWNIKDGDTYVLCWSNHDIPNGSADSETIYFSALEKYSTVSILNLTPDSFVISKSHINGFANEARRLGGVEGRLTIEQIKEIFANTTNNSGETLMDAMEVRF